MIFKKTAEADVDSPRHREVSLVLEQGISELIRVTPELNRRPMYPFSWSMTDVSDNQHNDEKTGPLFDEFEKHGLVPDSLHLLYMAWATKDTKDGSYSVSCHYFLGRKVHLKIEGPNRLIVDGIASEFQRMLERIRKVAESQDSEKVADTPSSVANVQATASVPVQTVPPVPTQGQSKENWFARTWREHTVTAVIGLIVTVVGAGVAAFFGFN